MAFATAFDGFGRFLPSFSLPSFSICSSWIYKKNSISIACPLFFPLFCPDIIVFSSIFDGFCFFLGFVLTFFTPDPAKSQKTLEMVRNTIPGLFPFVLCVFSHCFSQFFDGYCVIFWLRSHLFSSDPAKSQETLTLVAD
jgi:hypothetical protein